MGLPGAAEVQACLLVAANPRKVREASMKIATFNVNNIRKRLPKPPRMAGGGKAGHRCLQELKTEQKLFPEKEINGAGYHASGG